MAGGFLLRALACDLRYSGRKNLHAAWHRWHDIHRYRRRRSTGVWQYVTGSTRDWKSDLVRCVQRLTSLTGLLHVVYYDKVKDEHLLLYKTILDKCRFASSTGFYMKKIEINTLIGGTRFRCISNQAKKRLKLLCWQQNAVCSILLLEVTVVSSFAVKVLVSVR